MKPQSGSARAIVSMLVSVVLVVGSFALTGSATAAASADPAAARGAGAAGPAPTGLTVGQLADPVDVENLTAPLLGWQVGAGVQTGYQVQVATTAKGLTGRPDTWDSGRVAAAQNSSIAYGGPALTASNGYYWRVRTWGAAGRASAWSAPAHFGTGPGASWAGASAVWAAKVTPPGMWTDLTYTGTFDITAVAASVSFRVQDTNDLYLWQFRADGAADPDALKMHVAVGGAYTVLKEVPTPFPLLVGRAYDYRIVAVGSTFTTYLRASGDTDWTPVGTVTDSTYAGGGIGFRTGSTESATFDNLNVTDPSGKTLYSNDFSAPSSDFSCGTVSGGALAVGKSQNCGYSPWPATNTNWAFLRGDVTLKAHRGIAWAHLYATASSTKPAKQFVYRMTLNGKFVGAGPTQPVGSETRYDGYDVTSLLKPGAANTVGVLAYTTSDQRYEALLVVRYTDGTTQTLGSGPSWTALNGSSALPPSASIGTSYYTAPQENVDAAAYPFGFDTPGFDDSAWPAATVKAPFTDLVATPTAKMRQQIERPASVDEYAPGDYFVDYGRTWIGGMSLNLAGTAGQVVDIRYGEATSAPDTVRYKTSAGNTYEDRWTLKAGSQRLQTWGLRVFRYVQVTGAPTGLPAEDFTATAYVYPFDTGLATFKSSNSNLNQVWQFTKNTIQAVNENIYVDSWERERGEYEADDYLQLMANLYTGGDATLGTYSTQYLMANRTWPTEWPMYAIQSVHDTYLQTGDSSELTQDYNALQGKLPDKWFQASTGLIDKATGDTGASSSSDDDIVDWPAGDRDGYVFTPYNTVINAISYRSYTDMADLATALGRTADATAYTAKAVAIKSAVNARMWDPATGTYRDGLNSDGSPVNHDAIQAGVFAVAFGLASPSQAASVASYINTRGMACSVYCAAFLFQALYAGDRSDVADALLTSTGTNSYMNMINQGAGATMEAWTPAEKPNLTYSHPWAASPAFDIPQGMFGINPTTPGYDTFDIKPQPGTVAWAAITSPSVKGEIGAAYDTVSGRTDVGVSVPANAVARVLVPNVPAGTTSVYEDGLRTSGTVTDGYFAVDRVQPGCHVFSTAPGRAAEQDRRLTGVCPDR
ncbi:family 78 glycoside hydrolase catalytic domain [Streptacidiphilus sp. N1-3]|uniref:alpha-L-rhamnosidase n=1 Tax=Streptacidiphilus alkalitolerans TaxID=3342712 RepID=A0ABV6XD67_9ACTN